MEGGLGQNFKQRSGRAVEVNVAALTGIMNTLVQALASVLFEVQARDADALGAACGGFNVNISVLGQRLVVLRDLVSLGQVRIKIIFTSEDRSFVDAAVQRHRGQYRKLYYLLIEHRQRARKPQ